MSQVQTVGHNRQLKIKSFLFPKLILNLGNRFIREVNLLEFLFRPRSNPGGFGLSVAKDVIGGN